MKKFVLLLFILLLITGCSIKPVDEASIDTIVESMLTEKYDLANSYFSGYKYYLPRGLKLVNKKDYNAKFASSGNTYYLYVDIVAYYNHVNIKFTSNNTSYYSRSLNYNDKQGYIEITKSNDNYLVEIMYNYAKIETLVKERDLKKVITNSCLILASIQYNDSIIDTLIGENAFDYSETIFDIYGPHRNADEFLKYEENYQYDGDIGTNDNEVLKTDINE